MTRAVVLGGGFAGVLAAVALHEHVDEVTVLEGARYPAVPGPRGGLPQAHHNHVLVTGGAQALDELLPGSVADLLANGAHRRGLPDQARILAAEGWFEPCVTGSYLIACSRWLMDHVLRRHARAAGVPPVHEGVRVLGLTGTASRVNGVIVRRPDGLEETIVADLVVDASGRRSRSGRWLAELGGAMVDEESVDADLAYCTRVYRAPPGAGEIPAVMIHPSGRPAFGGTLFPIEDGRWIATLTCGHAAEVPRDEDGFLAAIAALPSPLIAQLLSAATPIGPVRPFAGTVNRRRYFERRPRTEGFLAVGDALVAVNPVFSHGMSIAAQTAVQLAREFRRRGADPAVLADLQPIVAGLAERSWTMATANANAAATGPAPARPSFARAVLVDRPLMAAFFRAQTLATAPVRS